MKTGQMKLRERWKDQSKEKNKKALKMELQKRREKMTGGEERGATGKRRRLKKQNKTKREEAKTTSGKQNAKIKSVAIE